MSHRTVIAAAAALALVAAGCGSSSSSNSSSAPTSSGTSSTPSAAPSTGGGKVLARTYAVGLKGAAEVPAGAAKGTGKAVISIRGKTTQLCWKFSALTGFDKPLVSHVHTGPVGKSGGVLVPLGGAFTPSGCTTAPANVLSQIEAAPKSFYVNVHSAKYPNGAVRAQL